MNKEKNDIASVITGASSGIGEEIASQLANQGYRLILVSRNRAHSTADISRLNQEIPQGIMTIVEADLADQDAVYHAATQILGLAHGVELLVNNVGVPLDGKLISKHGNEKRFQVNTLTPYVLLRLLRHALAAAKGRVVNVNSGSKARTGDLQVDELRAPKNWRKLLEPNAQ